MNSELSTKNYFIVAVENGFILFETSEMDSARKKWVFAELTVCFAFMQNLMLASLTPMDGGKK